VTVALEPRLEERAARLHRESIVVDTLSGGPPLFTEKMRQEALRLLGAGKSAMDALLATEEILVDQLASDPQARRDYLSAWDRAGVTCVSATQGGFGSPPFSFESGLEGIAATTRVLDAFPEDLVKVTRAEDIRRAHRENKRGIILNFQNTTHFGLALKRLELFYRLGIRIVQLTYNMRNFVGDGCTERTDAGLSHFGLELVRRLNDMGVLIDLSHCGTQTAWDAIRTSRQPVAFTHTFCKALSGHDRGKTDDLLKAVADTGGYVGILVVPFFIAGGPEVSLATFADHVAHAVEVCGIDHVGVGTDWGAVLPPEVADKLNQEMGAIGFRPEHRVDWNAKLPDYQSWEDWPNITRRLVERGFSDEEVQKILGLNFLRVFEQVVG